MPETRAFFGVQLRGFCLLRYPEADTLPFHFPGILLSFILSGASVRARRIRPEPRPDAPEVLPFVLKEPPFCLVRGELPVRTLNRGRCS